MNGLGVLPDAWPVFGGLGATALVVFVAAAWLGRWRLWLAGYVLAVGSLLVCFGARDRSPAPDPALEAVRPPAGIPARGESR